jgi:hypothetical protein
VVPRGETRPAREERERPGSKPAQQPAPVHDFGPAREDLGRIIGVYRDSD